MSKKISDLILNEVLSRQSDHHPTSKTLLGPHPYRGNRNICGDSFYIHESVLVRNKTGALVGGIITGIYQLDDDKTYIVRLLHSTETIHTTNVHGYGSID